MANYEDAINPYAVTSQIPPELPGMTGGIYHQGKYLVVHKNAELPDRCLKSNQPTSTRLKRKLVWHHPALYLLILLHVVIYVIVALIVRKTAQFHIPLSPKYKSRRIMWMLIAWSVFLASLLILFAGIATFDRTGGVLPALAMIQFPILLLLSALIGIYGCRVIYAKRIDDQFVWMGGVCEDFRRSFPEWPTT